MYKINNTYSLRFGEENQVENKLREKERKMKGERNRGGKGTREEREKG